VPKEIAMKSHRQSKKLFVIAVFVLSTLTSLAQVPGSGSAQPFAASSTSSGLHFLPPVNYSSSGLFAGSLAVADLNGDGRLDIMVANANSATVGVLLNNGDGTFRSAVTYESGPKATESIALGDLNGDGKEDVVAAGGLSSVTVLLGNGDGSFQLPLTYGSGGVPPTSVAVADVNGDKRLDVAVVNEDSNTIGVLLGNGDGTFQPVVTYPSGSIGFTYSVVVADVNLDGKQDLIVAADCIDFPSCTSGAVGVLLGNGDGTFQAAVTYLSGGCAVRSEVRSVAVGDLNGDGKPDLVVGSFACGLVGVLLGNGDGTFQAAVDYQLASFVIRSVGVTDVNGDGEPDVLVSGDIYVGTGKHAGLGILLGKGDGTLQPALTYSSVGDAAPSVVAADVNGDGKLDLVASGAEGNAISVRLNNTASLDTTPPTITLSATPKFLWPPTGSMLPVTVTGAITDTGSGVNQRTAAYSVKDEYGQLHPSSSITLGAGGSYSFTTLLQASRLGTDLDGRQYTVTVRASDNAGNAASTSTIVTVPHDQRH
jgi:uncharacterized protein (DUF2141 family)